LELRPQGCGWPGPGSDLVVVLDGGSGRFAAADRIGQALTQPPHCLLIRCPRGTPPPQPTPELLQGFDTATQITALALWRATGSTGAWLVPKVVARKRADCGV